jgi:hypothetical protein
MFFSTACWQWKQTTSCNGSLPRARLDAACQSASAFRTHSSVALFIKNLAPGHNLGVERLAFLQSPLQVFRRSHDQVHWERCWNLPADLNCLRMLVGGRHYDKDVHVAVCVRRTIGMGAKQDDLLGLKKFGHLARETTDHAHWNIGAAIVTRRRSGAGGLAAFFAHGCIVQRPAFGVCGVNQ